MLHQLTNLHTQPITEKKQKRPYSVNFPILGGIKYKFAPKTPTIKRKTKPAENYATIIPS